MNTAIQTYGEWIGLLPALPLTPLAGYVWLYLLLRCAGKLRVGAKGWHAASVHWGDRVVLPALRMFGFFQPLLRMESGIARRVARRLRRKRGQTVSEVVVELVPFA